MIGSDILNIQLNHMIVHWLLELHLIIKPPELEHESIRRAPSNRHCLPSRFIVNVIYLCLGQGLGLSASCSCIKQIGHSIHRRRRDAWLLVFYVHLLVLYALVACYMAIGSVAATTGCRLSSWDLQGAKFGLPLARRPAPIEKSMLSC